MLRNSYVRTFAKITLLILLVLVGAMSTMRTLGALYHNSSLEVRAALRQGLVPPTPVLENAARKLELSTSVWPYDSVARDDLGVVLLNLSSAKSKQGDFQAAQNYLESARQSYVVLLRGAPFYSPAWARYAVTLERQGLGYESIEAMQRSIATGPHHPWTAKLRIAWGARNWLYLDMAMQNHILSEAAQLWKFPGNRRFIENWIVSGPVDMRNRLLGVLSPVHRRQVLMTIMRNRGK